MSEPLAKVLPLSEVVARRFHEAYERLAPSFGYETRRESAVPWEDVPEANRLLMRAVVAEMFTLVNWEWDDYERAIIRPADQMPDAPEDAPLFRLRADSGRGSER